MLFAKPRKALALLALGLPLMAQAGQISLYPMEVKATAGDPKLPMLTVTNSPDTKTYIKATVKEIINPNTPQEKEVEVSGLNDTDLIVSPSKFVLAPGASKKVRMVFLNPLDKERDFRVYVTPITDEKELEEAAASLEGATPGTKAKKDLKTEVTLSIAWGALVRLLPATPKVSWSASEHDGKFWLKNTGNVRFHVRNVEHCADKASCPQIDKQGKSDEFNVYPGLEKMIGSVKDVPQLQFELLDGEGGKPVTLHAATLLAP